MIKAVLEIKRNPQVYRRGAGWSRQWRCCWDAHNGWGDGFKMMAGMPGMLPSTGWEKPQPVPTLLFGAMASYFSDETVLGPNVYKVLPNPCWPCGGLLQCHPGGQGEGGKALWPQRGPGQLECEGNGA